MTCVCRPAPDVAARNVRIARTVPQASALAQRALGAIASATISATIGQKNEKMAKRMPL